MSDLLVFTAAYYSDPSEWRWIRESAELLQIPLVAYGVGEPFPGLPTAKITNMVAFLEKRTEPYCLFADAGDSFFLEWNEPRVLRWLGRKMLIAAEDNCYPDASLSKKFPYTIYPWKYMCPGQFVGERQYVLDKLTVLRDRYIPSCGGMDQEHWHRAWADGVFEGAALDSACELFQTMSGPSGRYIEQRKNGDVLNHCTYSYPMSVHFNGRTPGIEEWFGKWKAGRA